MRRWHQDYARTYREWRRHWLMHVEFNMYRGRSPYEIDCPCDTQIGRFRKMDAYDCGTKHCWACHSVKYPRRTPTRQEVMAELTFNEGLEECLNQ